MRFLVIRECLRISTLESRHPERILRPWPKPYVPYRSRLRSDPHAFSLDAGPHCRSSSARSRELCKKTSQPLFQAVRCSRNLGNGSYLILTFSYHFHVDVATGFSSLPASARFRLSQIGP